VSDDVLGTLWYGSGWRPAGRPCARSTLQDHGGASKTSRSGQSRRRYKAADTSLYNLASRRRRQRTLRLVCACLV